MDKQYNIGHETIDNQHDELIDLTSMLDDAIVTGKSDPILGIIEFLEDYVQDHFKEEETLMLDHNYEGYDHHKDEHEGFVKDVVHLRQTWDSDLSKTHLIFEVRQLIDKLIQHIKTVDIGIKGLEKKE